MVAVVAAPVPAAGEEAEVVRVVGVVRVLRTRPVVAFGTSEDEVVSRAIAGSRKKNLTATRTGHKRAVDTVDCSPLSSTMLLQLRQPVTRRHHP